MQLRIKEIARQKGLTQKDIAEKMGCSVSMVQYIYKPTTNKSVETLSAIAAALGVHIAELFAAPGTPATAGAAHTHADGITCPHCGKRIALHASTD